MVYHLFLVNLRVKYHHRVDLNECLYRCTCDRGGKIEKKKNDWKWKSQSILSFKDESDALADEINTQLSLISF